MVNKQFINKIIHLRNISGGSIIICKKVLTEYPNALDEEQIFYVGYYSWLKHFYDGDRSIEAYRRYLESK